MVIPYAVARLNAKVTNRITVHLVGHAWVVELEHVGRRSGRVYRVPLREILTTGAPADLPADVGLARMPAPARAVLRVLRVDHFVELPALSRAPVAGSA